MDTEAEMIRTAIYDIGILDEVKKERDAAIAMVQPEIIRCKDCSKWKTIHCPFFSKYITVMPNEEQYCSYAERRTKG